LFLIKNIFDGKKFKNTISRVFNFSKFSENQDTTYNNKLTYVLQMHVLRPWASAAGEA